MKKKLLLSLLFFIIFIKLFGANFTWNGNIDNTWTTDANWNEPGFPNNPADNITIPDVGVNSYPTLDMARTFNNINLSTAASTLNLGVNDLTITGTISGPGTLNNTGSIILSGGSVDATGGIYNGNITVDAVGGTITSDGNIFNNLTVNGNLTLNDNFSGAGVLIDSGGSVTQNAELSVTGDVNVTNGTLTMGGNTFGCNNFIIALNGVVELYGQSQTITITSITANGLVRYNNPGTDNIHNVTFGGVVEIAGGDYSYNAGTPVINGDLHITSGTFNPNVATVTIGGSVIIETGASLDLTGSTDLITPEVILNGADLDLTGISYTNNITVNAGTSNLTPPGASTITNISVNGDLNILEQLTVTDLTINSGTTTLSAINSNVFATNLTIANVATLNLTDRNSEITGTLDCNGTISYASGDIILDGGIADFTGGNFNNGDIQSTAAGGTITSDGNVFTTINISGNTAVTDEITADTFNLNADFDLNVNNANVTNIINGSGSIINGGIVILNAAEMDCTGGLTFANGTVQADGVSILNSDANTTMDLVVNGTLALNDPGTAEFNSVTVNAPGTLNSNAPLQSGTITVTGILNNNDTVDTTTMTVAGTVNMGGEVTSGTLNLTGTMEMGAHNIIVSTTLDSSGTFNTTTGIIDARGTIGFTGGTCNPQLDITANATLNSSIVLPDVNITGGTTTLDGATSAANFTVDNGTFLALAGNNLTIGTLLDCNGTTTTTGGIVRLDGAHGDFTGGTYTGNITSIANGSAITSDGNTFNTLTINGNTTLNDAFVSNTLTVNGVNILTASDTVDTTTMTVAGTVNMGGGVTSGTLNLTGIMEMGAHNIIVNTELDSSGTFNTTTGIIDARGIIGFTGGTCNPQLDITANATLNSSIVLPDVNITGGTTTLDGATIVNDINILASSTGLALSNQTLTVNNSLSCNDAITLGTGYIIADSSDIEFTGGGTFTSGRIDFTTGAGTFNPGAGNFGTINIQADTSIPNTTNNLNTATLIINAGDTLSINDNDVFTTNTLTVNGEITTTTGEVTSRGTATFTAASYTGRFTTNGVTSFTTGTNNFTHVTIDNGGGNTTTLQDELTSSGLTVASGPFNTNNNNIDINGDVLISGGTLNASNIEIRISGDYERSGGSLTHTGGVVFFDGNTPGEITSVENQWNEFILDKNAPGTLTITGGSNQRCQYAGIYNGDLIFNGTATFRSTGEFVGYGAGFNNTNDLGETVVDDYGAGLPIALHDSGAPYTATIDFGATGSTLQVDGNLIFNGIDLSATANWTLTNAGKSRAYGTMDANFCQPSNWVAAARNGGANNNNHVFWDYVRPKVDVIDLYETTNDQGQGYTYYAIDLEYNEPIDAQGITTAFQVSNGAGGTDPNPQNNNIDIAADDIGGALLTAGNISGWGEFSIPGNIVAISDSTTGGGNDDANIVKGDANNTPTTITILLGGNYSDGGAIRGNTSPGGVFTPQSFYSIRDIAGNFCTDDTTGQTLNNTWDLTKDYPEFNEIHTKEKATTINGHLDTLSINFNQRIQIYDNDNTFGTIIDGAQNYSLTAPNNYNQNLPNGSFFDLEIDEIATPDTGQTPVVTYQNTHNFRFISSNGRREMLHNHNITSIDKAPPVIMSANIGIDDPVAYDNSPYFNDQNVFDSATFTGDYPGVNFDTGTIDFTSDTHHNTITMAFSEDVDINGIPIDDKATGYNFNPLARSTAAAFGDFIPSGANTILGGFGRFVGDITVTNNSNYIQVEDDRTVVIHIAGFYDTALAFPTFIGHIDDSTSSVPTTGDLFTTIADINITDTAAVPNTLVARDDGLNGADIPFVIDRDWDITSPDFRFISPVGAYPGDPHGIDADLSNGISNGNPTLSSIEFIMEESILDIENGTDVSSLFDIKFDDDNSSPTTNPTFSTNVQQHGGLINNLLVQSDSDDNDQGFSLIFTSTKPDYIRINWSYTPTAALYISDLRGNRLPSKATSKSLETAPPFIQETRAVVGSNKVYVRFNENVYDMFGNDISPSNFSLIDNTGGNLSINSITPLDNSKYKFIFNLNKPLNADHIVEDLFRANTDEVMDSLNSFMKDTDIYNWSDIGINFFENTIMEDFVHKNEEWEITNFDGTMKITPKSIKLRTIINIEKYSGLKPILYYDIYEDINDAKFWYPNFNRNAKMIVGRNISGNTWEFLIPGNNNKMKIGNIISMVFKIGDFYSYRSPHKLTDSNFSPYNAESYMVEITDIKKQTNNVTILNNVIAPNKGEITRLLYELNNSGPVSIIVYDLAGNIVKVLENSAVAKGEHLVEWNGKNNNGKTVARGVYFIRVRAPGIFNQIRKVLIIK